MQTIKLLIFQHHARWLTLPAHALECLYPASHISESVHHINYNQQRFQLVQPIERYQSGKPYKLIVLYYANIQSYLIAKAVGADNTPCLVTVDEASIKWHDSIKQSVIIKHLGKRIEAQLLT